MTDEAGPIDRDEVERRTKQLALRCIRVAEALPWRRLSARPMGQQLIRSATSVAANYRAARRARSSAEFASKLSIVVEEADEVELWLELIVDAGLLPSDDLVALREESGRLTRMFAKSRRTAMQSLGKG